MVPEGNNIMIDVESVSCEVSNGTVYIYDQYGNLVNTLTGFIGLVHAYSTGRCIIVDTDSMSYTYSVGRDGSVRQTGMRGRPNRPPSDDLIPSFAKPERSGGSSSSDYTPSYSSGGGGGSPGCWFAFIIFAILYCLIYEKGCSHNDGDRPPTVVKNEYQGKRGYIRKFIDEREECRIVAITKEGGNVAVVGKNTSAVCGTYPNKLWDALKEISNAGHRITDVCLTDKGKWVVLFGKNGYRSDGLPEQMCNWLSRFHDDKEALLSATVNDRGDWAVISDKHFISSSTKIQNRLNEGMAECGNPLSVSITDDAGVAVFERGYYWWGNYTKDLRESIKKSDFKPSVIRMAGDSWFYANESGKYYWYSM